jgi:1,4-alpha-glucan branching enzyme
MQEYHIDGLRVDAVASMLYLDYSREEGEWEPNEFGGRENLAAQGFLKDMNLELYSRFEGIQTIAEESTAFPMVSRPTDIGGLGFGMKWMMGWMHDTLAYMKKDSVYRKYHHNEISFSLTYAFTENFMLPLSHDEVVYGKKSILGRMPGDEWQRFANLRTLYTYMFTHPGAKLNFMGGDFGQHDEWNFEKSLDWHLTQYSYHKGIQELVKDLNNLYKSAKALHQLQFSSEGFEWLSYDDSENSILSYIRKGKSKRDRFVILCNFTPTPHQAYQIGVPEGNSLSLVFNSDASKYGGSDFKINNEYLISENYSHGKNQSVILRIPPLSTQVYKIV